MDASKNQGRTKTLGGRQKVPLDMSLDRLGVKHAKRARHVWETDKRGEKGKRQKKKDAHSVPLRHTGYFASWASRINYIAEILAPNQHR